MIKAGEFKDRHVGMYKVFEMITSTFYRIDICLSDAKEAFIATNKVVFSKVVRKKEFTLGNVEIYEEYLNIIAVTSSINKELVTSKQWDNGKFIFKQQRYIDDLHYYEIVNSNGRVDRELYVYEDSYIVLKVVQTDTFKELLPFNFNKYTSKDIGTKQDRIQTQEYVPYETLKTMYSIAHIDEMDYRVVEDLEEIEELKSLLLKRKRVAGFDTETDTLEWNMYSESNLAGFVISAEKGHSRYIPIMHEKFRSFDVQIFIDFMLWCRENNIIFGAHNKKFEIKIWLYYRYKHFLKTKELLPLMQIKEDSLEASVLNNPVVIKGAHELGNLVESITGRFYLNLKHIFLNTIYFPILDKETTRVYACPDADNTIEVLEYELNKMKEDHPTMKPLYDMECELTELKAEQEFYGFRVDGEATAKSAEVAKENKSIFKSLIHAWLGEELEINKPAVIMNLMYNTLKCNVLVRTKSGKPSTGAASLKKLAGLKRSKPSTSVKEDILNSKKHKLCDKDKLNSSKYPVLALLLEYRKWDKQINGFYQRIIRDTNNARLMISVNQNGTETGRQSSALHMTAKSVRHVFLSDSDDHVIIAADYRQMELRLFFSAAGEEEIVKLCEDYDADIHRIIAAISQGKELWDISAEERNADKARNFGIIYMIAGKGLAVSKYGVGATDEQVEKETKSIEEFYKTFKRSQRFMKQNALDAMANLYAETLFGRIRRFDELADPNLSSEKRASLLRRANNMPVQGTGADITKMAEVMVNRGIKARGWDKLVETPQGWLPYVRVMGSVHDELLVSKHKSIDTEAVLDLLTECMEMRLSKDGKPWAPLYIGCKIGTNWGDGKDDKLEIPIQLRLQLIEEYRKTGVSVIKTDNQKEEMLQIINNYRDKELSSYMEGLIKLHGTDIDSLWEALRHPSLTHELIDRFPQSDESQQKDGVWTHHERMRQAIMSYLEYRELSEESKQAQQSIKVEAKQEETAELMDLTQDLENMVSLAEDQQIFDEYEEDPEDIADEGLLEPEHVREILNRTSVSIEYVIEFFDSIYIDTDTLYDHEVNEVIKILWKDKVKDGFYTVHLIRNGDKIELPMSIEELTTREEVNNYIKKVTKEKYKVTG